MWRLAMKIYFWNSTHTNRRANKLTVWRKKKHCRFHSVFVIGISTWKIKWKLRQYFSPSLSLSSLNEFSSSGYFVCSWKFIMKICRFNGCSNWNLKLFCISMMENSSKDDDKWRLPQFAWTEIFLSTSFYQINEHHLNLITFAHRWQNHAVYSVFRLRCY